MKFWTDTQTRPYYRISPTRFLPWNFQSVTSDSSWKNWNGSCWMLFVSITRMKRRMTRTPSRRRRSSSSGKEESSSSEEEDEDNVSDKTNHRKHAVTTAQHQHHHTSTQTTAKCKYLNRLITNELNLTLTYFVQIVNNSSTNITITTNTATTVSNTSLNTTITHRSETRIFLKTASQGCFLETWLTSSGAGHLRGLENREHRIHTDFSCPRPHLAWRLDCIEMQLDVLPRLRSLSQSSLYDSVLGLGVVLGRESFSGPFLEDK